MMKKKSKKLLLWLFVLTFVLTGIAGCGTKQKDDQEAASTETAGAISSVDDIVGKKIGVQLGTTGDIYVSDYENDGSGTTVERYNKGAETLDLIFLLQKRQISNEAAVLQQVSTRSTPIL